MNRSTTRRAGRALACAVAAAAVMASGLATGAQAQQAPPRDSSARASAAGTITYVQGYNVWVANPDGTGARQVTTDGTAAAPWYSPTQSDAGMIVAGHGDLIHRMDQWGTPQGTLDPPDLRSGGGAVLGGPMSNVAVSPDGALIAYTYSRSYCSTYNNICKVWPVTGFTSSRQMSSPDQYGTSYGQTPAWVTSSRVTLDERTGFDNLYLNDVGRGRVGYYWFDDANINTDDLDLFDLEVSLSTPYGVAVRGSLDQARIVFYDFGQVGDFRTGVPSPPSSQLCQTTTVNGIGSPTVSADGALAAWHEPDGIWTIPLGAAPCTIEPSLVIAGGSSPSFSRAVLQTTRPETGGGDGPASTSFVKKRSPKIAGKARVGRRLTASKGVFDPSPTSVRFQWMRDKKPIKGAKKRTYRVTRKDRGHKLRVKVRLSRTGYSTKVVTSAPVRVKR